MKDEEGFLGIVGGAVSQFLILLFSVSACVVYLSRIPERFTFSRPVTQTVDQLAANPRSGWFRIPGCVIDLTAASYTSNKNGAVISIDAPAYGSRDDLGSETHVVVNTSNFADRETIEHIELMIAHGNRRNIPAWAEAHPDQAWPRRDIFGMVRSPRNKKDARDSYLVAASYLELEEGERPETWSILLFGVGGFAVSYWILRGWFRRWHKVFSRRRPKVYSPLIEPSLISIDPGPAKNGRLVPGQALTVPEGRWAAVFLYGRSYDGLPPGEYTLNPASLPKLAAAINEEEWIAIAADAVVLNVPFGQVEYRWKGTWQRLTADTERVETAPVEGLVDFEIKDGQAFAHYVVYCLALRLHKEKRASSWLPCRSDNDPPIEPAIEHLLRGKGDRFGEMIAECVAACADPDEEHGAITATAHGISMRAKAALEQGLASHGVEVADLTFIEPSVFETQACQCCGTTSKRLKAVSLSWIAGILFEWWDVERKGNYCRACGIRRAATFNGLTAVTAVWGLFSLIIGALAIYANTSAAASLLLGRRVGPNSWRR